MLAVNSERQKVTLVLKKDNKRLLELMAEKDNRNLSRQVDFLIEMYRDQSEQKIISLLEESETRIANGEKWLTGKEIEDRLGI